MPFTVITDPPAPYDGAPFDRKRAMERARENFYLNPRTRRVRVLDPAEQEIYVISRDDPAPADMV